MTQNKQIIHVRFLNGLKHYRFYAPETIKVGDLVETPSNGNQCNVAEVIKAYSKTKEPVTAEIIQKVGITGSTKPLRKKEYMSFFLKPETQKILDRVWRKK